MTALRAWRVPLVVVLVVAAIGLGLWLANRPTPVSSTRPAGAPAEGSCWTVTDQAARGTLPWPGGPGPCTAAHTVEVVHVGQIEHDIIARERAASGGDRTLLVNLMYAEVRRVCGSFATGYLGGNWHAAQVTVIADWIEPVADRFFGCGLARTADAAGTRLVPVSDSLRGVYTGEVPPPVAITCVNAPPGGEAGYVDCAQNHTGEFIGTYTITPIGAPFDAARLKTAVEQGCGDQLTRYLVLPPGGSRSDLTVAYVGPVTAPDWLGSDQTFACYARAGTAVRGSVQGLGTRPLPAGGGA